MPFSEFLQLVQTIKVLYGREYARDLFMKNYKQYYNLNDFFCESRFSPDFLEKPLPELESVVNL